MFRNPGRSRMGMHKAHRFVGFTDQCGASTGALMAKGHVSRYSSARPRRVAVVGCGHVGLVVGAGLARLGHSVVGLDRDPAIAEGLTRGITPFFEEGLDALVTEGLSSGQLSFTASYDQALRDAEIVFVAVDTPPAPSGAPDLANLRSAAASIAHSLHGSHPLVVIKSTVPVGTAAMVEEILASSNGQTPERTRVLANPEFLRQGQAVHDFFAPERTVIGAIRPSDAETVAELFAALPGALVVTDVATAEMIKYAANAFLATRLSFINEIAGLCDALGVDVDGVVEGIGHDPRIGHAFIRPGIGFGGSCLPKDVAAARHIAAVHGISTPLLAAVQAVNSSQPARAVRRLRAELGDLDGKTIAVWGATFKGGTDDARESPAIDVINLLIHEGAHVRIYDPSGMLGLPAHLSGSVRTDPLVAAAEADALAVLSDWREFANVDLDVLRTLMSGDVILDGRNVLDPSAAVDAGFRYVGMGRGNASPSATRLLAARSHRHSSRWQQEVATIATAEADSVPLPWEPLALAE